MKKREMSKEEMRAGIMDMAADAKMAMDDHFGGPSRRVTIVIYESDAYDQKGGGPRETMRWGFDLPRDVPTWPDGVKLIMEMEAGAGKPIEDIDAGLETQSVRKFLDKK